MSQTAGQSAVTTGAETRPLPTAIASESTYFPSANNPDVRSSTFNNVTGRNINLYSASATSGQAETQISLSDPIRPQSLNANANMTSAQMVQGDAEVYVRSLLAKRRGFPLWAPTPHRNLPEQYRKNGVDIGDVGIITANGVFDFLFNICLPADHPINDNLVPPDFSPLERPHIRHIITESTNTPMCIASGSIQMLRTPPQANTAGDSRAGFTFLCSASEGAMLSLPDGWDTADCRILAHLRKYAVENVENWYRFANGALGREAENGSIYLVTGCDKTKSWGLASFSNASSIFILNFTPSPAEDTYSWQEASFAAIKSGPVPVEYLPGSQERPSNQCTFIRGFRASLNPGLWASLWGQAAAVSMLEDSKPDDLFAKSGFVPFRSRGSWFGQSFRNSRSQGNRDAREDSGGDVIMASDILPTSYQYHPSDAINEHLLDQNPDARVAVTHDNDWCHLIGKDEDLVPNAPDLLARMHETYNTQLENGVVFLVPKSDSEAASDISTISIIKPEPEGYYGDISIIKPEPEGGDYYPYVENKVDIIQSRPPQYWPCQLLTGRVERAPSDYYEVEALSNIRQGILQEEGLKDIKQRLVLVKVPRGFVDETMLREQVTVLMALNHPNITPLLGITQDFDREGPPCLVFPYHRHGSILKYLKQHPNTEKLTLIAQIAEALLYLHDQSVVHGHVDGDNVFINDDCQACLIGFDLSRPLRPTAPELLQGFSLPRMETDVWDFSLTVLEIMTQRRPFAHIPTRADLILHIGSGRRPRRRDYKEIKDDIWQVLQRCWHPQPDMRPSMAELSGFFSGQVPASSKSSNQFDILMGS